MNEIAAELRLIAIDLELHRARLAQAAEYLNKTGSKTYNQDFIDATTAGWHAFSAARAASQLAERIETRERLAAASQKEESLT